MKDLTDSELKKIGELKKVDILFGIYVALMFLLMIPIWLWLESIIPQPYTICYSNTLCLVQTNGFLISFLTILLWGVVSIGITVIISFFALIIEKFEIFLRR